MIRILCIGLFFAQPAWGANSQLFSIPIPASLTKRLGVPEGLGALEEAVGLYEYRERLSSEAVPGLLNTRTHDQLTVSTGFFIAPSLFLVPRHPETGTLPEAKKIRIYTGTLSAPDKRDEQQSYTVKRVLQGNARYGFLLLEIDGRHRSHLQVGAVPHGGARAMRRAVAVGYTVSGARLVGTECVLERASCDFCESKEWQIEKMVWGKSRCLTKKGMHGAPLAVPYPEGRWTVVGMLGPLLRGQAGTDHWGQTYDETSVIRLSMVQARFGPDLSGRYRK